MFNIIYQSYSLPNLDKTHFRDALHRAQSPQRGKWCCQFLKYQNIWPLHWFKHEIIYKFLPLTKAIMFFKCIYKFYFTLVDFCNKKNSFRTWKWPFFSFSFLRASHNTKGDWWNHLIQREFDIIKNKKRSPCPVGPISIYQLNVVTAYRGTQNCHLYKTTYTETLLSLKSKRNWQDSFIIHNYSTITRNKISFIYTYIILISNWNPKECLNWPFVYRYWESCDQALQYNVIYVQCHTFVCFSILSLCT